MKRENERDYKVGWLQTGGEFQRTWGKSDMIKTHCIKLIKYLKITNENDQTAGLFIL